MKNIIPFKKDVIFKTNISEIVSISLENTLNLNKDVVSGDFIISGDYKVTENSSSVDNFDIKLPFEIVVDERYDCSHAKIDIDDFYYEIVNDNVLSISIDVLIDNLDEKPIVEIDDLVDLTPERTVLSNSLFLDEDKEACEERKEDKENKVNSLFSSNKFSNEEFITYNIFIVREQDTLESILEKYNITEEELKKYNDLSNIKLGDKIVIPTNSYEGN